MDGGVVDVVLFEGGDALGDVRGRIGDGLERAELFDSIVAGDGGMSARVETWRAMVCDVVFEAVAAVHPNLVCVVAPLAVVPLWLVDSVGMASGAPRLRSCGFAALRAPWGGVPRHGWLPLGGMVVRKEASGAPEA